MHGRDVAEAYDQVAADYDTTYATYRCLAEDFVVRRDLAPLVRGRDVLDVGCGTGYVPRLTGLDAARYTGCDLSPEMAWRGKQQFPSGTFVVEDQFDPTPRVHTHDLVTSLWSLNYASSPRQVERAAMFMWAALRPGGQIYVIMASPRRPRRIDYGVRTTGCYWSAGRTRRMFRQFTDVKIRGLGLCVDAMPAGLPQAVYDRATWVESHTLGRVAPDLFYFYVITGRK